MISLNSKVSIWRIFLCLAICLAALPISGCGGGSPASVNANNGTGRATMSIIWPPKSRLIPDASNSIRVDIMRSGTPITSKVVARPAAGGTSIVTLDNLPAGSFTAYATAYPQTDGTGIGQATASVPLTIQLGQTTNFTITMASTIDHLDLTPHDPSIGTGQGVQLTVTAKDIAGNIVLTSPAKLQWGHVGAAATVDANGLVSGGSEGSATISVTEQESGKSASVVVTVSDTPQTFVIGGKTYVTSNPKETLTVTFTQAEGGVTVSNYSDYVLVNVTGVGQSYNNALNDAFYIYDDPAGILATPINGWDGGEYQLAFDTSPLTLFAANRDIRGFLVGSLPAYRADHNYTFIFNTGLASPGSLHFGVSDGGFSDNTGAYTLKLTQLIPAP
jgi:hypothetical protein